jgi:hypothetical protein
VKYFDTLHASDAATQIPRGRGKLSLRGGDKAAKCRSDKCGDVESGVLGEVRSQNWKRSPAQRERETGMKSRVKELEVVTQSKDNAENDENAEVSVRFNGANDSDADGRTHAAISGNAKLPLGDRGPQWSTLELVEGV